MSEPIPRSTATPARRALAPMDSTVTRIVVASVAPIVTVVVFTIASAFPMVPRSVGLAVLSVTTVACAVLLARALANLRDTRAAEVELLEAAKRDRHLASLGEVSAVLAHEIRNPLAALKGHAQILAESVESGTKLHTKAERVVSEAIRVEKLTDDLLAFARSGKLRTRTIDLHPLVNQAVSIVGPESIVVRASATPIMADLDAGRMLQLLDNLLRNAIRHGKPPVEVFLDARDGVVVLEVRDHGKGIPEDRLDRIFEPFVSDATRGSGLGLAVVRRVAILHGGSVHASNHESGGACFRVELPRGASADAG